MFPSGAQLELRCGDQRAVVTEVGATLRCFQVAGVDLIDGFGAEELPSGGRGQLLCPWPNRVDGGRYEFAGQAQQLALTEVGRQNANHGLVRWLPFRVEAHHEGAAVLSLLLRPQPGYPFFLALQVTYTLDSRGLAVTLRARNPGTAPLPFGSGQHPYFTVGTARVDEALLQIPAATRLLCDARGIPVGREPVAGTGFDFQAPRPVGELVLDTCYTDLARDEAGLCLVRLAHPSGAPALTLGLDPTYAYLQAFSGDTLTPAARRRGLALEPMTCAPNALRSGEGLRVLGPGEELRSTWTLSAA